MHRPEVDVGKGLGNDCLHAVVTERSYEGVGDGDLVEPIDCGRSIDHVLPHEDCKPPALTPKFDQLRVCDGTRRFA
jgi:hypothetical protein